MRQGLAGMVLTAIAATGGVTAQAQSGSPAVRPEDAGTRALVARGLERSATFRHLYTRLGGSDVIVYVRFSRCPEGVAACLAWVSAGADARRLLIRLDRIGRSPDELTAFLAHELQHANEVASAPGITDLDSFRKAFASLGWKHGNGFETEAAKTVTRRVAAELTRAGRAHVRGHGSSPFERIDRTREPPFRGIDFP